MSQIYVLTSVSVQVWPDHILRAAQTCFQEGAHVLDLNQTFHEDVMCDMPEGKCNMSTWKVLACFSLIS